MSYLNQNLEGRDVPSGQLLTESDNPAEVYAPDHAGGNWSVMFFLSGQPYPSRMYFDSEAEAQTWAEEKAASLGVVIRLPLEE